MARKGNLGGVASLPADAVHDGQEHEHEDHHEDQEHEARRHIFDHLGYVRCGRFSGAGVDDDGACRKCANGEGSAYDESESQRCGDESFSEYSNHLQGKFTTQ